MKQLISIGCFVAIMMLIPLVANAETSLGTFVLSSGEEKVITFRADEETKVGWRTSYNIEQAEKCPDRLCIRLREQGEGSSIASMFGGALYAQPRDGKVSVVIENLASFPIKVEVYRE
ncbi:MAG: hypothetical protein SVW57_02295 [Thermodesulfobacteriota bacterium]|nr:hypothetical protein [Thermodesulfobacteriota bacterium]